MLEKLIYTNSAGQSIEFSTGSLFHVNIRKDVRGLFGVTTVYHTADIVEVDGKIETGFSVQSRDIDITGTIKSRTHTEQDLLINELTSVLSPFYTGILRYEGQTIKEIDVRVETVPDPQGKVGSRWPTFTIGMVALDPNWRDLGEIEKIIESAGTNVYYDGTKSGGIEIEITAGADGIDMESLTITNGDTVETITFRTPGGVDLDTGDVLVINTEQKNTSVQLNGVETLERIDFDNTAFPRIYPGKNVVSWLAHGDEADFAVMIRYTQQYIALRG